MEVFFDKVNIFNILDCITKNQFVCIRPRPLNNCLCETLCLTVQLENLPKNLI